jgi:hypothetical protein
MDPEDSKITLKSLLNNMKDDNPPDFIMPECFSILTVLYEMIDLDAISTFNSNLHLLDSSTKQVLCRVCDVIDVHVFLL